ncbi:unnamed protein product [Owenia fusiformis]|uniref:Uncharacterized protein n=1 Tax=Owenia fusiformis TaxID=6347 RepID=A0A8J1YA92_OWEFU|nr:unnamed protein product [Owenia fusiformis]
MASLVADYGTSSGEDSDVDGDVEEKFPATDITSKQNGVKDNDNVSPDDTTMQLCNTADPTTTAPSVNFLTADLSSDDSDNDEPNKKCQNEKSETKERLPNPLALSLPSPLLGDGIGSQAGVFKTKFQIAEEAKNSVLEQHVKMTVAETLKKKERKQICYKFRKGQCKFGKKCKYFHDVPNAGNSNDNSGNQEETSAKIVQHFGVSNFPQGEDLPVEVDDDSYMGQAKKKKRVGIAQQSLVPPKRAMKNLSKIREQERPWTMD